MIINSFAALEATDVHAFHTDASALGLKPGEWPDMIPATIGNGQPFVRDRIDRSADGDVISARYEQRLGCLRIYVWND